MDIRISRLLGAIEQPPVAPSACFAMPWSSSKSSHTQLNNELAPELTPDWSGQAASSGIAPSAIQGGGPSLLAFVFRLGLVNGEDVSRLQELFARGATPQQIEAFLAERLQDWGTWKAWFPRFERLSTAILKDPDASKALAILTAERVSEVDLLWGVVKYVAVREYMASPDAKRRRRRAEAHGDRLLKQLRKSPQKLRKVARELADDPRFLVLADSERRLLIDTHNHLKELAQAIESLPKECQPRLENIVTLSRRRDYTSLADNIRRYVKETTGNPHDRAIEAILCAACKEVGIDAPEAGSVRRHSYRPQQDIPTHTFFRQNVTITHARQCVCSPRDYRNIISCTDPDWEKAGGPGARHLRSHPGKPHRGA